MSAGSTLGTQLSLGVTNTLIPITTNTTSYNYNYGVWVYVNTWDTTGSKLIVQSDDSKFALYIDNGTPTLKLFIASTNGSSTYNGNSGTTIAITQNFPIQAWTHVALNVSQNYVDCYINGKLLKSVFINGGITQPQVNNVIVGGGSNYGKQTDQRQRTQGFDATIAKLTRQPTNVSPQDVWAAYMKGNGLNSWLTAYGVNIDLTKNGNIANTVTVI